MRAKARARFNRTRHSRVDLKAFGMQRDFAGFETRHVEHVGNHTQQMLAAFADMAHQLDLCDIRDTAMRFGVHRADGNPLVRQREPIGFDLRRRE